MPPILEAKAALRAEMRQRRRALAQQQPNAGRAIGETALAQGLILPDAVTAFYWPIGDEVDLRPLMERLAREGRPVALPCTPPEPGPLEAAYREELKAYGVVFNRLLTLTNMPIKRFRHALERDHQLEAYMDTLVTAFDAGNLEHVMCRSLLSVDWQGYVYDCDFNQMLGLPAGGTRRHLADLVGRNLVDEKIAVGDHCFGCTAGRGSSCGGALTA